MSKVSFFVLTLFILMTACTNEQATSDAQKAVSMESVSAEVKAAEAKLYTKENATAFNKESALATLAAYEKFITNFPQDPKTPEYLFKGAEIHRSLRAFDKAVSNYQTIWTKYKDYEKAPHSLFLLGFSYENDFKNTAKAKELYETFLKEYPEHELADDVQFSLNNIGVPAEEILKKFEEKNKKKDTK